VLPRCAISFLLVLATIAAEARTRPHYGGTLRVEIEGDPWQQPNGIARRLVYDGLTRIDSGGPAMGALASEWKSENGDHRWQFKLRPGVHFSDGTLVTSVNVVASLNASCPNNCPWGAVRALGGSVVFTSDSPMTVLPELLASDAYLIALPNPNASSDDRLLGTGPYQTAGFVNNVLKFSANENCWRGRPFAEAIEVRIHRAVRDQWLDLSLGRADVVEVPAEQLRQAQQNHIRVLTSTPVTLLALEVAETGALANPMLRAAISLGIDRGALSNVIYQKQGQVTGSLLPAELSGYAFLFPTDRDLNKAHELRGGLASTPLTLSAPGSPTLQLAAQRIVLNLREAGLNVQGATGVQRGDLNLRTFVLEDRDPQSSLESLLRAVGSTGPSEAGAGPAALYKVEHEFLDRKTLIPLLYLSRSYAASGRMRDLHLDAAGTPDLADASQEDAP
jgi:peptide/nickel transport system substrate-binding protein